ncbi:DNA-binding protein [Paraclostridium sordellii 8483]|uniref:helix-turn-helix domain-containing protein n=1 Tax=Paraclostridium sordellii TaxID=1505 RepID=UPI0002E04C64|nr:helix-turn-helix domain-containing protein [Paeniclostridium sordellii]TAN64152.1 DNA-binding protein [Paeniclostridium sordellii 8483]
MFKKLIKDTTNWTAKYIKDYNTMVAYYEKQLEEKNKIIDSLEKEIEILQSKSSKTLISDSDILKILELKKEGKSYRVISKETGWSKATICRVINNKKELYY